MVTRGAERSFYAPVDAELRELQRRLLEIGSGGHPTFAAAVQHLFGSPGKLLRPTLVFLSARFGPSHDAEVVLNLAQSLELVHTASLVHDDIVDEAELRRNVATVNATWDDDVALIVGDYLFAKAYALAAVLPKPEVIAIVAQTVFALCDGELNEVTSPPTMPTEAEPEHVAALGAFGTNLGLAFQITDDILDLVGDEAEFGKAVGRDLEEGMATLPMIYAAAESGSQNGELHRRIVAPGKSPREVIDLLRIIRASNGPERARARALAFHDSAVRALDGLPSRHEREALRDVADFVVSRVR